MRRIVLGSILFLLAGCDGPPEEKAVSVEVVKTVETTAVIEAVGAAVSRPVRMPAMAWSSSVFSFVVEEAGKFYLVTQEDGLDEVKAKSLKSLERRYSVEAQLAPEDIPPEDQKLVGKTFILFGKDGELCQAKVGPILAIARASQYDFDSVGVDFEKASNAKLAKVLWEDTQRLRVARLEGSTKCSGAIWGREATEKPANILARFDLNRDTKNQIWKRFKSLSGYATQQKRYAKYLAEVAAEKSEPLGKELDWSTVDASSVISGFKDSLTGREYVQIAVQGEGGCGSPNTQFWAIFAKGNSGQWEVVTSEDEPGRFFEAALAVDLNRDGHPEFIAANSSTYLTDDDRQLVELVGDFYAQTRATSATVGGCSC